VDAVTGATLPSHQTHSIIWNCKGASGTVVPNGNYKMWIEYTDKHAQGPIYSIDFTISGASQHVTPIDQAYFKNMSLDFTPVTTDISSSLMDRKLTILPNPSHGLVFINFSPETSSPVKLNVMDISGHLLLSKTIASAKLNNYELDLTKLGKGIYTIKIDTKTSTVSQKLVVN
jgi:flagellar hook assembly protein FlgD